MPEMNIGDQMEIAAEQRRHRTLIRICLYVLLIIVLWCACIYTWSTIASVHQVDEYVQLVMHSPCSRPGS